MAEKHVEEFDFQEFARNWDSPLVLRTQAGKFSGEFLHPRTMANLDSRGEGPERVYLGKRVAYPVNSLIEWMQRRYGRRTI